MTVSEIFETMEYGPAPESSAEALAWIVDKGAAFGHFIDGKMTAPQSDFAAKNPASGETLASLSQATKADVDAAVTAASKAQRKWAKLQCHQRAQHLYALARMVQKHARLFAVLETLDNGKPIRESRDIDIPLVARHFYYHAGMAALQDEELPDREPIGVCGQIIPWNFPLLMLAWKVAPALAMGNTVVLKPAEWTSLTALLFAELAHQAGLPKGVLNIVTGDGRVGEMIVNHESIVKIAFTGSTDVGKAIRRATAGTGKALTLELGGKSPYIVFDDADLDSAVEGLVDAIWFNQGQVCCAGSRLLVQEGIADAFYDKLRKRMQSLRIGDPLDKCIDIGAIIDPTHLESIKSKLSQTSGETFQAGKAPDGCYFPPTLISGLAPSDPLMQEEIFGPVLCAMTFRTPSEAVALANNTKYGLAASVWSENVNLCLDIAPKLAAGVVWVNATNLFDAAAGFGGVRESGFGREGGWEGLRAYTRSNAKTKSLARIEPKVGSGAISTLDRTAKFYVGGKQTRPDGGYSRMVFSSKGQPISEVGIANRKDIRNAVEAANKAKAWSSSTGHLRAQILYYIAENLSARKAEFVERIKLMTGSRNAEKEVALSIEQLFKYAAWSDKLDGSAKGVPMKGLALAINEPVGNIGVFCPDEAPLIGFVSTIAPTIAMGNRVIAIASEPFPLAATDFYQILETSDLPAGVVNILTGTHSELAPHLAGHFDVDAVWSFSSSDISKTIEHEAAGNVKRTWVNHGHTMDWFNPAPSTKAFLYAATDVKTIWVPYGEIL